MDQYWLNELKKASIEINPHIADDHIWNYQDHNNINRYAMNPKTYTEYKKAIEFEKIKAFNANLIDQFLKE